MDKELYVADTRCNLSFNDMIAKVEHTKNKTVYYYNKNYISGKTVQYEIFDGIWIVYHDFVLKMPELFSREETGYIEMNYCISGRCESDFVNNKMFYVAPGDFAVAVLASQHHKHNFPLENYKGISITINEENLNDFLENIFVETKITSSMLIDKMKEYGKYMIVSNDSDIQDIMRNIIVPDYTFWKEKATLKFAELILLLIDKDIEVSEVKRKYFDRNTINKVKMIKGNVIKNIDNYVTINKISEKYDIGTRTFAECFKEIYGKTYYAFIKEFRIKLAADMLLNTNNTVGDIAITVGYQNASKFSKAFSDIMGATPVYFRKNN